MPSDVLSWIKLRWEPIRSRRRSLSVRPRSFSFSSTTSGAIPAKAGIQVRSRCAVALDSRFRGSDANPMKSLKNFSDRH